MPLPRVAEQAASDIAQMLGGFDDDLIDYLADGGRPPNVNTIIDRLRPLVRDAVSAAVYDVDPDAPPQVITDQVNAQLTAIQTVLRQAVRDARNRRRRVPRRLPVQEPDETDRGFAARVGAVAALAAIIASARGRRRRARDVARNLSVRLPTPTAARVRMIVRTETAIGRNLHAATVAARTGKVILVLDARKGPTDEACERVNGKYATVDWIRRHPVEHPNCTRLGRPVNLPAGAHVTLLE